MEHLLASPALRRCPAPSSARRTVRPLAPDGSPVRRSGPGVAGGSPPRRNGQPDRPLRQWLSAAATHTPAAAGRRCAAPGYCLAAGRRSTRPRRPGQPFAARRRRTQPAGGRLTARRPAACRRVSSPRRRRAGTRKSTRALRWSDQVCTAIAAAHLPAVADAIRRIRVRFDAGFAFSFVDADLACGYGACLACVVPLANGNLTRACLHGPVFDLLELMGRGRRQCPGDGARPRMSPGRRPGDIVATLRP